MAATGERRILVVEDDQFVRTFLRRALARGELDVIEAVDGADALERLAGPDRPDAILLDGLLPDMHGLILARRVLDDPANVDLPLCFLTGAVQGRVAASAGISCLIKPIRPGELVDEILGLLAWADGGGSPIEERRAALGRLESGFLVGP